MSSASLPFDSIANHVLEEQIDNVVLLKQAYRAKFNQNAVVQMRLASVSDSLLIESYIKETVIPKIILNHQEIDRYYQEHQNEFRESYEYILKEAIFPRKELADSVVVLLDDGADFDFIANKYIEDKLNIIDKGQWVSLGSYPSVVQTDLAKLTVGKTSKAYPITDGWLVFKVKDRRPGKIKARADVEMQIREIMFQREFDKQMDSILATLKGHSKIVEFKDAIDRYFGSSKK
jgi:hypothetical protein